MGVKVGHPAAAAAAVAAAVPPIPRSRGEVEVRQGRRLFLIPSRHLGGGETRACCVRRVVPGEATYGLMEADSTIGCDVRSLLHNTGAKK